MIIRNMRWGYDGGGGCCCPGSTFVEIIVTHKEQNFFVVVSEYDSFQHVYISHVPLFDLFIEMNHQSVSFDDEYYKIEENTFEDYDYEIGDEPEEMNESEFSKVIHLARVAMQNYGESKGNDYETAQEFIKDYIGEDITDMKLPDLVYDDE